MTGQKPTLTAPSKPLPKDKLSSLLEAVVEDCRAVEAFADAWQELEPKLEPRIRWNMDVWVKVNFESGSGWDTANEEDIHGHGESFDASKILDCELCVAGATMLRRREPEGPWNWAVDYMRRGSFGAAYTELYGKEPDLETIEHLDDIQGVFETMTADRTSRATSDYLTWDEYGIIVTALRERGL